MWLVYGMCIEYSAIDWNGHEHMLSSKAIKLFSNAIRFDFRQMFYLLCMQIVVSREWTDERMEMMTPFENSN